MYQLKLLDRPAFGSPPRVRGGPARLARSMRLGKSLTVRTAAPRSRVLAVAQAEPLGATLLSCKLSRARTASGRLRRRLGRS